MSKTADARGSKLTRPESESESEERPALAGGFAPVSAQRSSSIQQAAKAPMLGGGETTQFQVPLDLLVLARNKERDKARSVAVTPVAPRPNSDEPPPSDELSEFRIEPQIEPAVAASISVRPPATSAAPPPAPSAALPPAPESAQLTPAVEERMPAVNPAPPAETDYVAMVAWLLLAALCLCAGYYGVELLLWQ